MLACCCILFWNCAPRAAKVQDANQLRRFAVCPADPLAGDVAESLGLQGISELTLDEIKTTARVNDFETLRHGV